jgi:hypothetical protein
MISNETQRQKAYDRLRRLTSDRVVRALGIADGDLANLSLGALINMSFLLHGDGGSTGNFSVSFGSSLELVGPDLIWLEPETNKAAVEQRVQ